MKKTFLFFTVFFVSLNIHAQLKNTKWKGTIEANTKMDVVFNFKNDTLSVSNATDGSNIETMTYMVKDSVLAMQKVFGRSNCEGTSIGKYKFEIKDDLLYIKLLSDTCNDRTSALNNSRWMKVK